MACPAPAKKTTTRGQRGCVTVSPCNVCVTHATLPMSYLCRSDVSSVARGHSELPTPPSCGYRGCFFAGAVQGRSLTRLGMKRNTGEMPYLIDYWPIWMGISRLLATFIGFIQGYVCADGKFA